MQEVDYIGARPIFAPDMIAFGTFTDFMTGRDVAEQQQWRNVWSHIDEFRFRPDIRAIVSPDRLQAVGMAIFNSTGYRQDGTSYDRPGRATVVFVRDNDRRAMARTAHASVAVPRRADAQLQEQAREALTLTTCWQLAVEDETPAGNRPDRRPKRRK